MKIAIGLLISFSFFATISLICFISFYHTTFIIITILKWIIGYVGQLNCYLIITFLDYCSRNFIISCWFVLFMELIIYIIYLSLVKLNPNETGCKLFNHFSLIYIFLYWFFYCLKCVLFYPHTNSFVLRLVEDHRLLKWQSNRTSM